MWLQEYKVKKHLSKTAEKTFIIKSRCKTTCDGNSKQKFCSYCLKCWLQALMHKVQGQRNNFRTCLKILEFSWISTAAVTVLAIAFLVFPLGYATRWNHYKWVFPREEIQRIEVRQSWRQNNRITMFIIFMIFTH